MRILHVNFSSRIAGAERYCVDLANRQAAGGHDVHVAGSPDSPVAEALKNGARFHPSGFRFFRNIFLRRLLRQISPDICHGHLSPACKVLAEMPDETTKVATLHVGYKPHQHARLDGLICVNAAQAKGLGGYSGIARTIPNWLPQSPSVVSPQSVRNELGLAADTFLVGAVGRLHASKGMDVLISAFRNFAPTNAALAIVGEGPQFRQLKRLAAQDRRVHFLGYRKNVDDCLRDFDLFVSPSREESFGLAILEAMNARVPIIATMVEGPMEYLIDQPIELVPAGSIHALTDALVEAHRLFRANELPRIDYNLHQFAPATGVASVARFYSQVIEAKRWKGTTATRHKAPAS